MGFAQNIKNARNRAGMTQAELAKKCGIATITIRQYESGKREPRMEQLSRIASALGLSVGDLVAQDPAGISGLKSGIISPTDIAEKLDIPVEIVWDAIHRPENIPEELREKIGAVGVLLTLDRSEPENRNTAEALKQIAYSLYRLNAEGQRIAVERIVELTEIPKYQRKKD